MLSKGMYIASLKHHYIFKGTYGYAYSIPSCITHGHM